MTGRPGNAALAGARLPRWRRLLIARGVVPGWDVAHERVTIVTRDGIRLAGTFIGSGRRRAVVVAHGFGGRSTKPSYAVLAQALALEADVLSIDLRGHGASTGRCTLGDREVLDVTASAAWLRARGATWIGGVGASMGATALLRAGGGVPGAFDAVAAISAPAELAPGEHASAPVRRLAAIAGSGTGRASARLATGVRLAPRWATPRNPLAVVATAAHPQLLLVHGVDDHWFAPDHAERLAGVGRDVVTWYEPAGFGHAEDGLTPWFGRRLARAVATCATTGRWPTRAQSEETHL